MADTKLRSPDGREGWFNEKEVAHLTNRPEGGSWTKVETTEEAPRDPHDVIDPAEAPSAETVESVDPKVDKKGKGK